MTEVKMTFMEHVAELRGRIKISLLMFILTFFIAYLFSDRILLFIWSSFLSQFAEERFILFASSVMSGFVTQINLSFILAATISMPVMIYEMFRFIEPALGRKHKWIAVKIMLSAIFLFILGVLFIYFIMLPILLTFFVESNTHLGITNYFSVENFFNFVIFNLFIGGLIFQTPLIMTMANRIGLLPKSLMVSSRRVVYILILLIAGILTPDHSVVSQLILGGVMISLFEVSLLFSK